MRRRINCDAMSDAGPQAWCPGHRGTSPASAAKGRPVNRLARWLEYAGRRGWQIGGVAVGVYVLWILYRQLTLLVLIVFVAALMTAFLLPIARWLERRGLSRTPATVAAVLGSVVAAGGALWLLGWRIAGQMSELTSQFDQVRTGLVEAVRDGPVPLPTTAVQRPMSQLGQWASSNTSEVAQQVIGVIGAAGGLVTAVVLAFFLVRDGDRMAQWLLDHLVDPDQRDRVETAAREAGGTLQGYVQAVVIIGGLDALLIGVALLVLGVPLAVPLAVLTFIGGFFPVVGATVAGLLAALVALASGGIVDAIIVVTVVVAVQQIDGNVLQPLIMGRVVHIHPAVVLLALTAGGLVAGIPGAFMAVPAVAVATAVVREMWVDSPDGIG